MKKPKINPALARKYLTKNRKKHCLCQKTVSSYLKAMLTNRWLNPGHLTIMFSVDAEKTSGGGYTRRKDHEKAH